jgi:hypothetical protein
MWPILNEKQKRFFAAIEADIMGFGGISVMSKITGFSKKTINRGLRELDDPLVETDRIRRTGGGRQRIELNDPTLVDDLKMILEESNPLKGQKNPPCTTRSVLSITTELQELGHDVRTRKIGYLIHDLGYILKGKRKLYAGEHSIESDLNFDLKNKRINSGLKRSQASVDTKKKEMSKNLKEREKSLAKKKRTSKK